MNIKTNLKEKKAITLIALVVTIIVLLILAGVSIQMLTGENGVLTRAGEAKDKTDLAGAKEALALGYTHAIGEKFLSNDASTVFTKMKEYMEANGYPVVAGEAGDLVSDITLSINTISVGTGKNKPVEVTLITPPPSENATYYVQVNGKYHKILPKATCEYEIEETVTSNQIVTQGFEGEANTLKVTSKDTSKVTASLSNKTITITGVALTDSNTPVKVEVVYGNSTTEKYKKEIDVTVANTISSSDIASAADEFYGSELQFTSENGYNTWKIFYADSSNIYIIASDYIPYTDTIKGKGGTGHPFIQGDTTFKYQFGTSKTTGVMQDYPNGTDEIVDTNYATAATIKALNSKYFETYPTKQDQTNKRAVASMLDTTVWKGYMDKSDLTGKAQYAIGGPTIEMLFNSYNEKYKLFNSENKGKYQVDVPSESNTGVGYKISTNYGAEGSWNSSIESSSDYLSTSDPLYINQPNDYSNAYGYWLASPSDNNTYGVIQVNYHCSVDNSFCNYGHYGFRPLVCLKSGIQLEKVENGKYKIAE